MKKTIIFLIPFFFSGCFSILPYQTNFSFDNTPQGNADNHAIDNHKDSMIESGKDKSTYPIVKGIYEVKFQEQKKEVEIIKNDLEKCNKILTQCQNYDLEDLTK